MNDKDKTEAAPNSRSPRAGTIELVQIVALLTLVMACFIYAAGHPLLSGAVGIISIALVYLSVRLALVPEKPEYEDWGRGFMITPKRLETISLIGVPVDIVEAIEKKVLDKWYPSAYELQRALVVVLGEERVKPWLEVIMRHAKYYDDKPPLDATADARPLAIMRTPG